MKAEHRKELQTNALADRMGRLIQRMKTRPSRGSVLTVFLILLVGGALLFFFSVRGQSASREAGRWLVFERTANAYDPRNPGEPRESEARYRELADAYGKLPVGQAATFQAAWIGLWDFGIRDLMRAPTQAGNNILKAKEMYEKLAEQCKDDPILGPEALYNQAVAEEALAGWPKEIILHDPEKHLDAALGLYREVAKKYKDSAHGKDAEKRAAELEDRDGARRQISKFYRDMEDQLRQRVWLDQLSQQRGKKDAK